MIQRESAINLLQELVQKLESSPFHLPKESEILNDDLKINKESLSTWRSKVDSLVRELCIKWLSEEMNLETVMQLWVNSLAEDEDFLKAFTKLGEIIENWKGDLRRSFMKDESLYSMPSDLIPEENLASLESESEGSISEND
jgi:hypothetical protein